MKGRPGCLGPNAQELSLQMIQFKGNHSDFNYEVTLTLILEKLENIVF